MNKTKILVIAIESYCQEIAPILERKKYLVIEASNEQAALELAQNQLPDLIICQLKASGLDGYEILAQLRQDFHTATIPLIFLTPNAEVQQWRKGMEMGANDFLTEPIKASELDKAIAARLSQKLAYQAQAQLELEKVRQNIANFLPHEIHTALTGILTSVNLLETRLDSLELPAIREILGCISLSGQRLYRLMSNILSYNELQIISQKPQQIQALRNHQTKSGKEIVEAIVSRITQKYGRQADLYLEIQDASVQISQANLAKLVEELIDNACKFSCLGTPIRLTTKITHNGWLCAISDRGRGMSEQQIAEIGAYIQFERNTYEQQGSGLGLALAQQIVQIHGGQLLIDSILSQGTQVSFLLPLVQSATTLEWKAANQIIAS